MKRFLSLFLFAILFGSYTMAYDFSAVCETGQTLYYNITSNVEPYTVEVTSEVVPAQYFNPYYITYPEGDLVIPEIVTDNGITYTVTNIGAKAFNGCNRLSSVTIPNSVTSIGTNAFYNCSGLSALLLGESSVITMGNAVFYNCSSLREPIYNSKCFIYFPRGYATEYTIPEGITHIARLAFYQCYELTSVTIPNSVTNIDSEAFQECIALLSVSIPNSVTSIGRSAFYGCSSLSSVNFNATNCISMASPFNGCSSLRNLNIGDNVTNIPASAFSGCTGLTSVTIPNSVTSIGSSAFSGCSGLTSVTIGTGVTNIESYAFENCSGLLAVYYMGTIAQWCGITFVDRLANPLFYAHNLYVDNNPVTDLVIPNDVSEIKLNAFYGATCLTSVTLSESITNIGSAAFRNCSGLTAVYYTGTIAQWCGIAFPDRFANPLYSAHNLYIDNSLVTNLVIPETVTEINESAFSGATCLTSVTIPNSVTIIGKCAFFACRGIVGELIIPNSVVSIGIGDDASGGTFFDCNNITSIRIGNSVRSIGMCAFESCSSVTSLIIGNSVEDIGDRAFLGCSSISEITYKSRNIRTIFSSSPFSACAQNLRKINLGDSIVLIPDYMFNGCNVLDTISVLSERPPVLYANTFDYTNFMSNIQVIVPCGTIPAYENANFWYSFRNIQQDASCPVPYTITVLSSNPNYGTVTGGGVYLENTTATLTATPYEECMFVNWNDGNTDNPREITVTEDATYIATFVRGTYNPTIYNAITDTACGSYTWNGDIYTESGEYEQTFTAANSVDSVVTLTLTILPLPVPEITVDGILDACNPETTSVTLHTGEYDSYIWSNAATGESTIVTTPGEYSVEVVDSMGCHGFSEGVTVGYSTILTEAPYITNVGMKNNGYNMLQWDMDAADTVGVRGFYIYREDAAANAFSFIKHINKPRARSFTDSTADPTARAYRYKICAVDECGGMSPVSTPHRTMHLTINQGIGNTWNLIWSPYEGLPIRSYKIYRGTTMQNMVVIGEVPGNQTSYTDNGNPYNAGFFYKVVTIKNTRSDNEEDEDIMLSSNVVDNGYIVMRTVIVAPSNPANGTASGSGSYPDGTIVTLWATANAGYEFSAWNDGSAENPRSVTITSDTLFIANFVEIPQTPTHTITVYSSNQAYGTVSGGGTYEEGSEIQLIATANNGYEFVSWSDGSIENPHAITITEDAMYIATFIEAQPIRNFTVTVISANPTQGTVIGGGSYPEGTEITIEAIANEGYEFISWSDNNTENPRQITVTADAMYIATFMSENGVDEFEATETEIFPNPATDILNITSSETISEIEIVNVMGQVVKRMEVNSNNAVCDVEDLKAGVYIVRIHGTVVSQRKFIKE